MTRKEFLKIVNDNTSNVEQLHAIHTAFDKYCASQHSNNAVLCEPKAEPLPMEFIAWYSGMPPHKILAAYQRYMAEIGNGA